MDSADMIICPVTTWNKEKFTLHNLINLFGDSKVVLNKSQAALLYIELHKFLIQ